MQLYYFFLLKASILEILFSLIYDFGTLVIRHNCVVSYAWALFSYCSLCIKLYTPSDTWSGDYLLRFKQIKTSKWICGWGGQRDVRGPPPQRMRLVAYLVQHPVSYSLVSVALGGQQTGIVMMVILWSLHWKCVGLNCTVWMQGRFSPVLFSDLSSPGGICPMVGYRTSTGVCILQLQGSPTWCPWEPRCPLTPF